MVTDSSIEYFYSPDILGMPIAFVIDQEVLYTAAILHTFGEILLNATSFKDVSSMYPEHDGITIEILSGEEVVETWKTTEYVGSIILSSPLILDMSKYKNGIYVYDLNSTFDGTKFIIKEEFKRDNLIYE
jgi:hypothetical protein